MFRLILTVVFTLAALNPADAHTGLGSAFSFTQGLAHPVTGFDHMAAMIAVGLWSVSAQPKDPWLWPASFVAAMVGGALLARTGVQLPLIESAILASLVAIGLLLALALRVSLVLGAGIVAAFAVAHGFAHGAEAPGEDVAWYIAGFALSTAALHAVGMTAGFACRGEAGRKATRIAGMLIAAFGIALFTV